jgi:cysteine-S-conjugate beta-lyase
MNSQFNKVIERRQSGSVKWDQAPLIFGEQDILPMWIADMDFAVAEPISEAIVRRSRHPVYGYHTVPDSLKEAVVDRLERKFGWQVKKEWLIFSAGVVHTLYHVIMAFTRPGDGVVIQPPVYYPFFSAVSGNGCRVIENQLIEDKGRYRMNHEALETCFLPDRTGLRPRPSKARILLLCSPHNPGGRVWAEEELARATQIAAKHEALIISDEIHAELIFGGNQHVPTAMLNEDIAARTITCFSASKTFNLAGLNASVLIIPDRHLRRLFRERTEGFISSPCVYGQTAMEAAFRHGDPWLEELLDYLEHNLRFLEDFVRSRMPGIEVMSPEGTYLAWLDCRRLNLSDAQLRSLMRSEARVGLDDGYIFGSGGSGFQRINFACPTSRLEEALVRIERALQKRHYAG